VRRATENAVPRGMAVLCAVALAGVLAGCGSHASGLQPAGSVISPTDSSAAAVSGSGGAGGAGVDSDLNSVDGQLSGLDSALAQATQSPSDGG
jgi:hypothetical protein